MILKFRYYDKVTNSFVYSEKFSKIAPDGNSYDLQSLVGFFEKARYYSSYEKVDQWTGETDKNGRDIYQRDILKLDGWNGVQQVVFLEGAFCLGFPNGEFSGDIHYIHHAGVEQATVIGNTYQDEKLFGLN